MHIEEKFRSQEVGHTHHLIWLYLKSGFASLANMVAAVHLSNPL